MTHDELRHWAEQEQAKQTTFRCRVFCCASTPYLASGAGTVQSAIEASLSSRGLKGEVEVVATGCMGVPVLRRAKVHRGKCVKCH